MVAPWPTWHGPIPPPAEVNSSAPIPRTGLCSPAIRGKREKARSNAAPSPLASLTNTSTLPRAEHARPKPSQHQQRDRSGEGHRIRRGRAALPRSATTSSNASGRCEVCPPRRGGEGGRGSSVLPAHGCKLKAKPRAGRRPQAAAARPCPRRRTEIFPARAARSHRPNNGSRGAGRLWARTPPATGRALPTK